MKNRFYLLLIIGCIFQGCTIEAEYEYLGAYEYEVTDEDLLDRTVLSEQSFGFGIGDLYVQGIKIYGIENLANDKDYVITRNHPAKGIYKESEGTRDQNENETRKKPLDIVLNKNITSNHVYIYELALKDEYRLLLP